MRSELIDELKSIAGADAVTADPVETLVYGYDAHHDSAGPEVVVWPVTEEQVAGVLRVANREEIPVYPRGAGSGRAGGAVPEAGGIVLSLERMNRILEIDPANRQAVVEPGVKTGELKDAVAKHGLMYPPDPASANYSTIGGNIATSAGGLSCLKYGTTKEYVQQIRVVLADGSALTLGSKAQKSVTGYDLVHLFVGSEGTLGVIVRARLKLLPKPGKKAVLLAGFPSIASAAAAVVRIINLPVTPTGIEFADRGTLECARRFAGAGIDSSCESMLLIQMDSPNAESDIGRVAEICSECGADPVTYSADPVEADALWNVRRCFSQATSKAARRKIAEDISVPAAAIPEALDRIYAVGEKHGQRIVCFGHAGDGNIHVNLLIDDPLDPGIEPCVEDVLRAVVELEGTLSGEHGIGTAKSKYLSLELGEGEIAAMLRVKRLFDPKNILNPGKLFAGAGPDRASPIPE